jgi:hypothetical protein
VRIFQYLGGVSINPKAYAGRYKEIFLSHLGNDENFAIQLAKKIESSGISTFYYERDMRPFFDHIQQASEAIDHAKAVIVILSPHILERDTLNFVEWETEYAFQKYRKILFILKDISYIQIPKKYMTIMAAQVPVMIKESDPDVFDKITAPLMDLFELLHSSENSSSQSSGTHADEQIAITLEKEEKLSIFNEQQLDGFLAEIGMKREQFNNNSLSILGNAIAYAGEDEKTGSPHIFYSLCEVDGLPLKKYLDERGFPSDLFIHFFQQGLKLRQNEQQQQESYPLPSENLAAMLQQSLQYAETRGDRITEYDILHSFLNANGYSVGRFLKVYYGIILLDLAYAMNAEAGGNVSGTLSDAISLFDVRGNLDLDKFEEPAAELIIQARKVAQCFGHALIGRRHILYSILRKPPEVFRERLQTVNLDPVELKNLFGNSNLMPQSNVAESTLSLNTTDISPDLARVIIDAGEKAKKNSSQKISELNLLDALFQDPEDHLVQFLFRRGFRWNA